MRVPAILLLVFTAMALAFIIPEGTPDGFYVAYYDESGLEVHKPHSIPDAIFEKNTTRDSSRRSPADEVSTITDFYVSWCGCGFTVNVSYSYFANTYSCLVYKCCENLS
jgi:hypothetical protein